MFATLIAALLLAPETPVQLASADAPRSALAAEAPVAEEADASASTEAKICRRTSVQRAGLVTQSRKVCRTAAEWKAASR